MQQKPIPYRKTVFVCVNVREGKVACANPGRGGDEICRALKEAVKVAGLKENIRVVRSGWIGGHFSSGSHHRHQHSLVNVDTSYFVAHSSPFSGEMVEHTTN